MAKKDDKPVVEAAPEVVDRVQEEEKKALDKTPTFLHMKQDHAHGLAGDLKAGNVYRIETYIAEQISKDFPDKARIVSAEEARFILEEHKKKLSASEKVILKSVEESPENKAVESSPSRK